jgi:hypothetical protein
MTVCMVVPNILCFCHHCQRSNPNSHTLSTTSFNSLFWSCPEFSSFIVTRLINNGPL